MCTHEYGNIKHIICHLCPLRWPPYKETEEYIYNIYIHTDI